MPESKTYLADCMNPETGLPSFPDKYFDLAVVDPPYGIGVGKMAYLQEQNTTVLQKNGTRLRPRKTLYKKSDWDKVAPPQNYFNELLRVSKNLIVFGIEYMKWDGVPSGRIIWNKCIPDGLSFKKTESALCTMHEKEVEIKLLYSGFNRAKSLSEPESAIKDYRKIEQRIHPTEKPVLLYDWIYKRYAQPGMKILDTHLGSGSNRISAYKAGMDFSAFELDPDYFAAQEDRFRKFLIEYGTPDPAKAIPGQQINLF